MIFGEQSKGFLAAMSVAILAASWFFIITWHNMDGISSAEVIRNSCSCPRLGQTISYTSKCRVHGAAIAQERAIVILLLEGLEPHPPFDEISYRKAKADGVRLVMQRIEDDQLPRAEIRNDTHAHPPLG
jgi:hypothetical protein